MTKLWPGEDERSPLSSAFDEAATPVRSNCALVVYQRDGESDDELEARARAEEAADKLGRYLVVVSFVGARNGRPAGGEREPEDQPLEEHV